MSIFDVKRVPDPKKQNLRNCVNMFDSTLYNYFHVHLDSIDFYYFAGLRNS